MLEHFTGETAIFWDCEGDKVPAAGKRVYIGNEFCDKALPAREVLFAALRTCEERRGKATFVTPFMTEKGLRAAAALSGVINAMICCDEIVVNDWGFLSVIGEWAPQKKLIAGRLLVSRYFPGQDDEALSAGKSSQDAAARYLFPEEFLSFMGGYGVKAIEFNSWKHAQVASRQLQAHGIAANLYIPYAYVTTSRFCSCAHQFKSFPRSLDFICHKECGSIMANVGYDKSAAAMIIRGNTYFIYQHLAEQKRGVETIQRIIINDAGVDIGRGDEDKNSVK